MAKKKLSEIISVDSNDPNLIYVNNQWSFRLPQNVKYDVDCSFDGGFGGGIDLSNPQKPMVIKSKNSNYAKLLNFALERHFHLLGNFETVMDCKYDNRAADDSGTFVQRIIKDEKDLFVDIVCECMLFIGNDFQIRVRGTNIEPFNFCTFVKEFDESDVSVLFDFAREIANSVTLLSSKKTTSAKTKTTKSAPQGFNDPDYIVEGTVLRKYIGKDKNLKLPSGLTEIPDGTFSPMNIESIVIPEGVKTIGRRAFEGCDKLKKVVLPSTIKELGGYCFCDCHKLQLIILPGKIKEVSDSLFSECYELENVVIPKGVKRIDAFAFKNCRKFTSIVIPNGVELIGFTAFTNCKNLEYLYIPASVTLIQDNYADETPFGGCDKLTIHCPAGSYAEEYCKSHGINYKIDAKPKKVSIPIDSVDDFEDDDFDPVAAEKAKAEIMNAFSDITASLDSILEQTQALAEEARQREQAKIDEATKRGKYIPIEFKPNNIFPKDFAELLEQGKPYPKYRENDFETLVRRVKEIMGSDISDVPEDVLRPNDDWWSTNTTQYSAERIMRLWNNYLLSLKGVETDFGVWQIELWGGGYCDKIDALLFELDDKFWLNGFVSEDEDFEIDAKGLLKKYNGTASNIVIPEGVVQFASGKFYNSNKKISNVTSLILPSTLKKVDIQSELPFQKLRSLSRVDVSADNEVFSSVDGVLLSKDGTELIYYPVAKRTEEYKVPSTVTKIRSGAFTRNHYIKKLIISGNVVDTGENNFCNCTNLVTVIFENGVKIIGKNSFAECTLLQEVFVGESVEKLLMTTFAKCTGIKTIYACEGSKAMVNGEKLSTKLGAKLIVCKPGQVYDDVSVKPEKQETKTVTKVIAKPVQTAQPNKPQAPAKANNGTVSAPPPVVEKTAEQPKKSGCYVATAVYGSYDCPEVWTLRRFRDYSLAATLLGRLFIMLYYAISPALVKWFGNTKWFKKIWKAILDKMVEKLQRNGFENTPYED